MNLLHGMPTGFLVPESILDSEVFQVLATFVALNSLMYATLALLKVLPRGYAIFRFDGRNRRRANRSIYPDGPGRRFASETAPATPTAEPPEPVTVLAELRQPDPASTATPAAVRGAA